MTEKQETGFDWAEAGLPNPEQANAEQIEKHNEAVIQSSRLAHEVFSEGPGLEFLKFLEDCTTEIPLLTVTGTIGGGEIGLSPSDWAYYREGQNSIVRMIKAKMKLATMDLEKEQNDG